MESLQFEITRTLIQLVLMRPLNVVRRDLHDELIRLNCNEGKFYEAIKIHGPHMGLTSNEWFEILSRLPNRILRSDLDLNRILSEEQLLRLPPVSG